jgi:hypothetical protein
MAIVEPMAFRLFSFLEQVAVPDWIITFREWKAMGLDKNFQLQSMRGIMMGTPISWLVLNLYNRFCRDTARAASISNKHWREVVATQPIEVSFMIPYTIFCGDDCASSGVRPELDSFLEILICSGAEPSPGVNSISMEFATFTELFFIKEGNQFKLIPVPKLALLLNYLLLVSLGRKKYL